MCSEIFRSIALFSLFSGRLSHMGSVQTVHFQPAPCLFHLRGLFPGYHIARLPSLRKSKAEEAALSRKLWFNSFDINGLGVIFWLTPVISGDGCSILNQSFREIFL
jgi:hypothetical protein